MKIHVKTPAKINLFLEIKDKRADGYHNLESIMQTVSLYDELSFETTNSKNISLECNDKTLPCNSINTVYKAVQIIKTYFNIDKGVNIHLKKNIPVGAGLGGGSSDAAITLITLTRLWNIRTTKKELEHLAVKLGADVPFFLTGRTALCKGIGEIVTQLKNIDNLNIVLVNPGFEIQTTSIYKKIKFPLTNQMKIHTIKTHIFNRTFNKTNAFSCCFNRLEKFVFPEYPEVMNIRNILNNLNCFALMSGSGATVFGLFDYIQFETIKLNLKKYNWKVWFVNTTNQSI
ncbi:MAG: 4-(cytidine 5'-diphospho)-2-C-methyl-D-erythritol kinase [Endomicrobium sp.]|jgi:4-diphosphocytidyl-2-C-methyl-D-erythritol kinase|nr:4-(cytidine 5'-diphospho)-2-C-methyl-D-erythritol kinase [Endomicrobium sp.]